MRRNSGKDEGRNRNLDPTMREHERERGRSGSAVHDGGATKTRIAANAAQRTTGMGSHTRKQGQRGS